MLELAGMAAARVVVTALTRYSLADTNIAARLGATLVNFVIAVPLLAACLGPFHLRRLRRGLREQLRGRRRP